jgi:cytochrome c oxidase subunit 2
MAIQSPEHRLWWNERIERTELVWIAIAFLWGLTMFGTMIAWHVYGRQNLANEAYRVQPDAYVAKVEAMAEKYKVGEEGNTGVPVVHPPPGGDVYLLARTWQWWPVLELEKGQSYRLHLSSADWQHGFSLQPVNINIQVHPGYEMILTMTPDEAGEYGIVCNEFCGIGHHTMTGRVRVVEKGAK